jgi:CRP-like cAMP-binding protein
MSPNPDDTRQKAERLGATSIFSAVGEDAKAMAALASACTLKTYEKGETVVTEGELDNRMFIIKSGTVEVRKRSLHGDPYTVTRLSSEGHDFFGELGLIDTDKRSATVTCTSACQMYVITRQRFDEFGVEHPRLALLVTREIAKILCQRLRRADQDIITLFGALVEEVAESGGVTE